MTDEWATIFDNRGSELTKFMYDGWRTSMHPPGDPTDYDRGTSHIEWATGKTERLDYQLFGNATEEALVPHHLHQRIRNGSDHASLESVVQMVSPNCQPATGVALITINPSAGGGPGEPSTLQLVWLELAPPRHVPMDLRRPPRHVHGLGRRRPRSAALCPERSHPSA